MQSLLSATFNWYGFLIAMGVFLGVVIAYITAKLRGVDTDVVFDIAIWAVPLAVVGARLYYAAFDDEVWTFKELIGFQSDGSFRLEGLAIYGAVLGALLGVFFNSLVYKKQGKEITFAQMCDLGAPFLLLGQAIGRWGNYANQEAYGGVTTWTTFPFAVNINGVYHYATFFYESMWNILGAVLLYCLYMGKRRSYPGFVACVYFIWYGLGRAIIEGMRTDSLMAGDLRVSQVLSIILMGVCLILVIYKIYRARTDNLKLPILVQYSEWSQTGMEMALFGNPPGTRVKIFDFKLKKKSALTDDKPADTDEPKDGGDGGA